MHFNLTRAQRINLMRNELDEIRTTQMRQTDVIDSRVPGLKPIVRLLVRTIVMFAGTIGYTIIWFQHVGRPTRLVRVDAARWRWHLVEMGLKTSITA